MTEEHITLRTAAPEDAAALLDIYGHYVENTAVSFEYEVPGEAEFRGRIEQTLREYPYIVAERAGEIVGYAYAGPFSGRMAYARSASVTIYVAHTLRRQGVGRRLYRALEGLLQAQNILNMNACIGYPEREDDPYLTRDSARFHARMGFEKAGEFHRCGYKFSRWYNIIWMEKLIGPHGAHPAPVIAFPELPAGVLEGLGVRSNAGTEK